MASREIRNLRFAGLLWARLGSNQRPLACEAIYLEPQILGVCRGKRQQDGPTFVFGSTTSSRGFAAIWARGRPLWPKRAAFRATRESILRTPLSQCSGSRLSLIAHCDTRELSALSSASRRKHKRRAAGRDAAAQMHRKQRDLCPGSSQRVPASASIAACSISQPTAAAAARERPLGTRGCFATESRIARRR
jgi:hypothetical protein